MLLLDANLLIYAFREEFPQHQKARNWLTARLGTQAIGVPTLSETAFLRLTTKPLGDLKPASWTQAWAFVSAMLAHPLARRVTAGGRHPEILNRLATTYGLQGDDVTDAWLAALALEFEATLVSADKGFARFQELRWHNPLAD